MSKRKKAAIGKRTDRGNTTIRIKSVAESLKISKEEAKRISKGLINLTSIEKLKHGTVLRKQDGKYYQEIAGTGIKRELNAKQYAGKIRSQNRLRDDKGRMISEAKDTRYKIAAKNAGVKNEFIQKFVINNIKQLEKYPIKYRDELHIGSAIKTASTYKDYTVKINGQKKKFSELLGFLSDVNADIDKAQKSKTGTPNIFIIYEVDEETKTLKVFYSTKQDEEEEEEEY
jgi:hypothetical protein